MSIAEVHALAADARRMEHEIATAAESLADAATGDARRLLERVAHGARIRQLLWDSRLPDTHYISTGRPAPLEVPSESASPPADRAGLAEHLVLLRVLYAEALPRVSRELDPATHELLERGLEGAGSSLADLEG